MSPRYLNLRSLRNLFRNGGLDQVRIDLVRSLPRKYLTTPIRILSEYARVLNEDHPASLPIHTSGSLRIAWVLHSIPPAGGGLLTIFRTVQHLELWGHENRIYVGSLPGSTAETKEMVSRNYCPINAEIAALSDGVKDSDVLIATSWPTAYDVRRIGNTGRKFYFVQDLEYMFYAHGSAYEFAQQTYRFGFYGITAGFWIADVLRYDFNMSCTAFGFSYDRGEYSATGDPMLPSGKRRVLFYARPETERRGFELGILTLMMVAKRVSDVEFVLVGFAPESVEIPFPAITPGIVSPSALGALYRSCEVALVLSYTNLSLVPLELMACGCAVVSNAGPNTEWLLNRQNTQLADLNPESLAGALVELLENDQLRHERIAAGLAFVETTDWVKESKVIEGALFAGLDSPIRLTPDA